MRMLALAGLCACRVHAPSEPCARVFLGSCVDPMVPLTTCERGRARNLDDGSCTTTRETRELARTAGVYVDENDVIECEDKNEELVASRRIGRIGCIAREGPPPSPSCPARTLRSADTCAPLERGGVVDVASWSRAAAAELCVRLSRSPLVVASTETAITVELSVSVPANDLTRAFVRVRTQPAIVDSDLARALAPVDDALRRLGGSASTSEASAAATCRASSRRPISVP
jgi:hypothetical protein